MPLLLVTIIILLGGHPVPHARLQCAEISRMVDTPCTWTDDATGRCKAWGMAPDPSDNNGAVLQTDSRGHMVLTLTPSDLHCRIWDKEGVPLERYFPAMACPTQVIQTHLENTPSVNSCKIPAVLQPDDF